MDIRKGIAVSPGIAISRPLVIDSRDFRIPKRSILASEKNKEVRRVRAAFADAISKLTDLDENTQISEGKIKDIFAVHLRFLKDKSFRKRITDYVTEQFVTAEFAVSTILHEIAQSFASLEDEYLSERATDIYDIERRLLEYLMGTVYDDISKLDKEVIIVAHDLTPTETAAFDKKFVKGFATEAGGRTSHTAIVARSLGIPAVVALEDVRRNITSKSTVIVDGNRGMLIVDPDESTLAEYEEYAKEFSILEHKLDALADKPAVTRDGVEVKLLGNIEFPHEAVLVKEKGGEGIGLYRSEFLYLSSGSEPTEEEHFEAYVEAVKEFSDKPVVIRTMDLGADKLPHSLRSIPETNPVLGLRSIRFCLQHLTMFKTQLRAILRASAFGDVRILLPLITNLQELRQSKMIIHDVMEDLDEYKISFNRDIPIGIMIETPSAALTAGLYSADSDFFSIGTNDLIQYTLAADRANERVSSISTAADPAVLRLIRSVVLEANKAKIDLGVCGEVASDPDYVMLLLGLGVRTLSMAHPMIPEIKQIIRSVTIEECNHIARQVSRMDSQRQIKNYLRNAAKKILPEVF